MIIITDKIIEISTGKYIHKTHLCIYLYGHSIIQKQTKNEKQKGSASVQLHID